MSKLLPHPPVPLSLSSSNEVVHHISRLVVLQKIRSLVLDATSAVHHDVCSQVGNMRPPQVIFLSRIATPSLASSALSPSPWSARLAPTRWVIGCFSQPLLRLDEAIPTGGDMLRLGIVAVALHLFDKIGSFLTCLLASIVLFSHMYVVHAMV